jgi:uncharacterized NAD(P)/FAD-binding protein YdhS
VNAPAGPFRDGRREDGAKTIVIVGGGFTGAAVAHQLARRAPGRFRIVVVEPRTRIGGGVAYSTLEAAQRINVPASRMSLLQSDPCNFDRWLRADGALRDDPAALLPDGRAFPARAVFGRYVAESLEPFLLSGEVEHVSTRVVDILPGADGRTTVELADGSTVVADYVALAMTHPAPTLPSALKDIADDPRLLRDTQAHSVFDAVRPDARVLIIGTGLTMADIVASLDARGHRGPIIAISRRGLLSRGHTDVAGEFGTFVEPPSKTALSLLRHIRRTVAAAAAENRPWQHVLDVVRNQGPQIWAALPKRERAKLVNRLRAFWDVHRFRVAPQIEAVIKRRIADGSLTVLVGEPVSAHSVDNEIEVALKLRRGGIRVERFDVVALATGPAHRALVEDDPLVSRLAKAGLVGPDPFGLGLAVDERSRAICANGRPSPTLWVAGPLARGTVGELMGLPEVSRHAEAVAGDIVKSHVFGFDHAS